MINASLSSLEEFLDFYFIAQSGSYTFKMYLT